MRKIKSLLLFLTISISFAQNSNYSITNSQLYYSLKFKVLENYSGYIDKDKILKMDSIITKTDLFNIQKIKSNGFTNFDFYKIIYNNVCSTITEQYIIGYHIYGKKFYRLKGFLNNDFYYLYKFETRIDSGSPINLLSIKKKKYFIKNHFIEDIDIDCLIKNINVKENWRIPCLNPSQKILLDDYGEEHW